MFYLGDVNEIAELLIEYGADVCEFTILFLSKLFEILNCYKSHEIRRKVS